MKARLLKLSALIQQRNYIDEEIGCLIGRPAMLGHAGEFIAATVLDIQPVEYAALHSVDGLFSSGALAGKSVSVKWYRQQNGVLDIHPTVLPDYYLVMTGPRYSDGLACSAAQPWLIDTVCLFETVSLIRRLKVHRLPIGVATPLPHVWWREAEIYPRPNSPLLKLTVSQIELLKLFGLEDASERPNTDGAYGIQDTRPYM